jgi:hypothetical protein
LIFIGSIIGYIIKPVRDAYKSLTWKDEIEVVYFSSNVGVTVKNSGDGDVFLESVSYNINEKYKKYYSGATAVFIPAEKDKFTTYRKNRSFIGEVVKKDQEFEDKAVEPVFCSDNDFAYKTFQSSLKEEMLTFSCEAKLNYYSLNKSVTKSVNIPCVAYLIRKMSANNANSADANSRAAD